MTFKMPEKKGNPDSAHADWNCDIKPVQAQTRLVEGWGGNPEKIYQAHNHQAESYADEDGNAGLNAAGDQEDKRQGKMKRNQHVT